MIFTTQYPIFSLSQSPIFLSNYLNLNKRNLSILRYEILQDTKYSTNTLTYEIA